MRVAVVVVLLTTVMAVLTAPVDPMASGSQYAYEVALFETFKMACNKEYKSKEESQRRFKNFRESLHLIDERHKRAMEGHDIPVGALNQFADYDKTELLNYVLSKTNQPWIKQDGSNDEIRPTSHSDCIINVYSKNNKQLSRE